MARPQRVTASARSTGSAAGAGTAGGRRGKRSQRGLLEGGLSGFLGHSDANPKKFGGLTDARLSGKSADTGRMLKSAQFFCPRADSAEAAGAFRDRQNTLADSPRALRGIASEQRGTTAAIGAGDAPKA
jgi:hypothetical protein